MPNKSVYVHRVLFAGCLSVMITSSFSRTRRLSLVFPVVVDVLLSTAHWKGQNLHRLRSFIELVEIFQ